MEQANLQWETIMNALSWMPKALDYRAWSAEWLAAPPVLRFRRTSSRR
jgi:hypothetical protein